MVLTKAVKLNQSISKFLKFVSGLGIDLADGEQLFLWDEVQVVTGHLTDVQDYSILASRRPKLQTPAIQPL